MSAVHQHHGGGHAHRASADANVRVLLTAGALIVAFMAGEVVAGLAAHSLALLSDAAHMLTDAAAIGLAIITVRLAARPARGGYTYGLRRLEILSAQANGITLVLLAAWLCYEAVRRLISPQPVTGPLMLSVALAGVAVNLAASWLLVRANGASDRRSLNMEGTVAHVLTDLYAFLATVVAAIVVLTTGFDRADPIATLVVVALMLRAGIRLIGESGRIFLEAAPAGLDPAALGTAMASRPHVAEVHDLHVWEITTGMPAASAHVLVRPHEDCHAVRADLEAMLAREHGITHLTLQVDHAQDDTITLSGPPRPADDADHHDADHHDTDHHDTDHHGTDHHGTGHADPGHHGADGDDDGDEHAHPASSPHCEESHGPAYRPAS